MSTTDALNRSIAARAMMLVGDESRLLDALLVRIELHRYKSGPIDIAHPEAMVDDAVLATLAARIAQRDRDAAERIASVEADEISWELVP
jgi:hypothetical protein